MKRELFYGLGIHFKAIKREGKGALMLATMVFAVQILLSTFLLTVL